MRREFRQLIDAGVPVLAAGSARKHPLRFVARYPPSFKLELFGTRFYLTTVRQNPSLRFCVAYLAQPHYRTGRLQIYARVFYKDGSLVWRCASHIAREGKGIWIGKGAVRTTLRDDGYEYIQSVEATTDLPLEMQTALEVLGRKVTRVKPDHKALFQLLRRVPQGRIEPYREFVDPRRRAQADRRRLINGGRPVAYFRKRDDPTSLRFVAGYEPDFGRVLEHARSHSNLYGGTIERYRVLSKNKRIQYLFFCGPENAWIVPPQALTSELSSFGVRVIDVRIDDNLCVPGYEYHYPVDDSVDPPEIHSQIPAGFVGHVNVHDASRSDASPWIEQMPVMREFRRRLCRA